MSQSHTRELQLIRAAHLANVSLLEETAPKQCPDAAARAQRTIANLRTQVRAVDDQLQRTKGRAAK